MSFLLFSLTYKNYIKFVFLFCDRFLKTYDAFNKQKEVLEYFSSREFTFVPDRTVALLDELSVEEKSDFPCDIAEVDWKKFFYNYFHISRLRLVKNENLEGKPALQELALKRARRLV